MSLANINPQDVFFTFSRLRPKFSCGRRVQDTLDAILDGTLRASDLPPISVLLDPATGHLFSLNNRRLYVFKALQAAGRLETVPVRVKPVPQTKRMRDKYAADKCAKTARLMLEREALERLGSGDEAEGVNGDGEGQKEMDVSRDGSSAAVVAAPASSKKPSKPVRNMDDWTDEEDIGKKKKEKGKKGR